MFKVLIGLLFCFVLISCGHINRGLESNSGLQLKFITQVKVPSSPEQGFVLKVYAEEFEIGFFNSINRFDFKGNLLSKVNFDSIHISDFCVLYDTIYFCSNGELYQADWSGKISERFPFGNSMVEADGKIYTDFQAYDPESQGIDNFISVFDRQSHALDRIDGLDFNGMSFEIVKNVLMFLDETATLTEHDLGNGVTKREKLNWKNDNLTWLLTKLNRDLMIRTVDSARHDVLVVLDEKLNPILEYDIESKLPDYFNEYEANQEFWFEHPSGIVYCTFNENVYLMIYSNDRYYSLYQVIW